MRVTCLWCCKCASVSDWMSHGWIECAHKMFTRIESDWLHAVMSFFTHKHTLTLICVCGTQIALWIELLLILFVHFFFFIWQIDQTENHPHTQIRIFSLSKSCYSSISRMKLTEEKSILMRKNSYDFLFYVCIDAWVCAKNHEFDIWIMLERVLVRCFQEELAHFSWSRSLVWLGQKNTFSHHAFFDVSSFCAALPQFTEIRHQTKYIFYSISYILIK